MISSTFLGGNANGTYRLYLSVLLFKIGSRLDRALSYAILEAFIVSVRIFFTKRRKLGEGKGGNCSHSQAQTYAYVIGQCVLCTILFVGI